jgi:hypothetical protein
MAMGLFIGMMLMVADVGVCAVFSFWNALLSPLCVLLSFFFSLSFAFAFVLFCLLLSQLLNLGGCVGVGVGGGGRR